MGKNQAQWQKDPGYLALNAKSQKQSVLKELYRKEPEMKVPGQQLRTTKPNTTNSGILMEEMRLTRELEETAMEGLYRGANISKVLSQTEIKINSNLTQTNRANNYFK